MFHLIVSQDGREWTAAECETREQANMIGIDLALIYDEVSIIHDKEVRE